MLVILKPIYLYIYTYIYDPAGHQLLGGALGGGHPGGHHNHYQQLQQQHQHPQQQAFEDFNRTISSIRNEFHNFSNVTQRNNDYNVHSCPTSPPTTHPFMPQNWQNSPPQQQQLRQRSPSPTPQFQPPFRAQSQQTQYSPAVTPSSAPRRQPFPLRKPEVIVKEYPGCASTGNYRLNCSNEELTSSNVQPGITTPAGETISSPHLLRPSKFWPVSQQQHQQQRSHGQLHQLAEKQMHRQTSQPSLPTTQQQPNQSHDHVIVLHPQNTGSFGSSNVHQARSQSPSAQQQYSKYKQSSEDLQTLLKSLQQRQQQQQSNLPADNFAWTNSLSRGQSKSTGRLSPSSVEMRDYNRSNSAFSRPLQQFHGSGQEKSYHLQEPFEPAFGRQAITPPPGYTYDYHRSAHSPPPPPLVKATLNSSIFGPSQSGRGSFSGDGGNYFKHRSNNGSSETMDQYHSASSTLYSSKPNLIVVNRSPMGSNGSVHQQQQTLSGQSSPQPFVPQSPGAKPFYYSFRP